MVAYVSTFLDFLEYTAPGLPLDGVGVMVADVFQPSCLEDMAKQAKVSLKRHADETGTAGAHACVVSAFFEVRQLPTPVWCSSTDF